MGFSITALAQKARTTTLIADSDLNLGNYDLIASDVKGDTAEFDEFVGGVGNFSNVLGSGNLDIEGTGNIKGLTTFQNAVQVNGALHVEGSINNVNIADNGDITAGTYNGVPIKSSGNITVKTSNTILGYIGNGNNADLTPTCVTLLPPNGCLYSGTISLKSTVSTYINIMTGLNGDADIFSLEADTKTDYTFTNIPMLVLMQRRGFGYMQLYKFSLS